MEDIKYKPWNGEPDEAAIAKRLREMADIVEAEGYPRVMDYQDDVVGSITTVMIQVSYPWCG